MEGKIKAHPTRGGLLRKEELARVYTCVLSPCANVALWALSFSDSAHEHGSGIKRASLLELSLWRTKHFPQSAQ